MKMPFLLACLILLARPSAAQTTLTAADIRDRAARGGSFETWEARSSYGLAELAQAAGPAQVWDFAALPFRASYSLNIAEAAPPVPGADDPFFASANLVLASRWSRPGEADSVQYQYIDLRQDAMLGIGAVIVAGASRTTLKPTPAVRLLALPLAMGTSWTSAYKAPVSQGGLTLMLEATEASEVVGWGTMLLPRGDGNQAEDALMVSTRRLYRFILTIFGRPIEFQRQETLVYSYYARSGSIAMITTDLTGSPLQGSLIVSESQTTAVAEAPVPVQPGCALKISPNPSAGPATFALDGCPSEAASFTVFDLMGRTVRQIEAEATGEGRVLWDGRGAAGEPLPSGTYAVRARCAGGTESSALMTVVH